MPGTVSTIPVISRRVMLGRRSRREREGESKWNKLDGGFGHSETSSPTTPRLTQPAWLKTEETFESQMPCLNWKKQSPKERSIKSASIFDPEFDAE